MLHELLLALSGHAGSIFIRDAQSDSIRVVRELPFMHPSETAMLDRLCKLATLYSKLNRFVQSHRPSPLNASNVTGSPVPGLYVRAFCQGLDDVLDGYRKCLLGLEKQLLADPYLTAAHAQTSLEGYQLLFPSLCAVVDEIVKMKIAGGSLLELLYGAMSCGMPDVKEAFRSIMKTCHGVLYKQLAAWMLYGQLIDQFDEFFIHKSVKEKKPIVAPPADIDQSLGGVTGRQLDYILSLSKQLPFDAEVYDSYEIQSTQLPSYIPLRAAEKILFVGESVHMFELQRDRSRDHRAMVSVLNEKVDEFCVCINDLSQQDNFDVMNFEEVIDKIRSYVAERLWDLVVGQADLVSSLRVVKDFYLLGRGELFLEFIDLSQGHLRNMPSSSMLRDTNMAFQAAARNVLFDNESLLKRFKLTFEEGSVNEAAGSSSSRQKSTDSAAAASRTELGNKREIGWNCLRLMYEVDWPLHIFFTSNVLARYNTLFSFLLYIKRIQLQLQQCWSLQMHRRHIRCQDTSSANKWWLRNHMAFLVDNLQYYLQVDVIESQFSVLLNKIDSTHDFEAIRHAHDVFLSSLLSQSFVHMKHIAHCLGEILELCQKFCNLMIFSDVVMSAQELQQVEEITKSFQRQSSLLFTLLSSVRSHQASPHLAQLLLRIDFNRYFTLTSSQLSLAPRVAEQSAHRAV